MAEEKPFDPTPSKIAKARREGNVPRSQEMNTVATFLIAGLAIMAMMPMAGAVMREWFMAIPRDPLSWHLDLAMQLCLVIAVPLVCECVAGTLMTVVQGGGLIVTGIKLKPEKLKPDEGFKRMFGGEAAVGALRGTLAFILASVALIGTFAELFARAQGVEPLGVYASLALVGAERAALAAIIVAGVFSIADVVLVRNRWKKKLRMDLYELKRDNIETEGNPHIKNRRRALHRGLLRGAVNRVQQANFVVANPTHIAIAIEYHFPEVPVPKVLVIATDDVAERVKIMAIQFGIPVIENRPLARCLLKIAKVERPIPTETFVAVAEIVMALRRKGATAS